MAFQLDRLKGDGVGAVLARGASGSMAVKIVGAAIAFGVQVLLARVLGVENFGIYTFGITCINLLAILGMLGMNSAAIRFVSTYNAESSWGLLKGFLSKSWQITVVTSIFISVVCAAGLILFGGGLEPAQFNTYLIALAVLPLFVLLQVRCACIQGLKKVVAALAPRLVARPVLIVAGIILLYVFTTDQTAYISAPAAMSVEIIAVMGSLLLANWLLRLYLPASARSSKVDYDTNEWIRVSVPLLLISGFHLLITNTDIVMLGMLSGTTNSGLYAVAVKISNLVAFGLVAANHIAAPMIAELYSLGKIKQLQRMASLSALIAFLFMAPISIFLVIWGDFVLELFGPGFAVSYYPLVILIVGQLINALAGSVGQLMTMTNHQKEAMYMMAITAFLNILLNIMLIPIYGLMGAAIATTFTTILWNVSMFVYVIKVVKINSSLFSVMSLRK